MKDVKDPDQASSECYCSVIGGRKFLCSGCAEALTQERDRLRERLSMVCTAEGARMAQEHLTALERVLRKWLRRPPRLADGSTTNLDADNQLLAETMNLLAPRELRFVHCGLPDHGDRFLRCVTTMEKDKS